MTEATESSSKPLVTFKKPRGRPQTSKRRTSPTADDAVEDAAPSSSTEPTVIRPEKRQAANPLIQGSSKRLREKEREERERELSDLAWTADESMRQDNFATRSADFDLESKPEDVARKVRVNEDGEIEDGMYHGAANSYKSHIQARPDGATSKFKAGPVRATANIRSISIIDYQPDVCKDYKETGFCGYGDSCKFLHDRGDYLAGWQLDKLAPEGAEEVEEVDPEEEVPFACLLCRKPFTEPIITKCGHYFCQACAIKRFQKSGKCYACGQSTNGIFNKAEKIIAKIEKRNKEKRKAKEEDELVKYGESGIVFGGDGEEGSGGEDGQEEGQEYGSQEGSEQEADE